MNLTTEPSLICRFAPTESDAGHFQGIASTASIDRHLDCVTSDAFDNSIAALTAGKQIIPLLMDHDAKRQIGRITTAVATSLGLLISGRVVGGTPDADRVLQLAKADAVSLSVGFVPIDMELLPTGGRLFKKVDWLETSAVAAGSNRESRVLTIRSALESGPSELAALLRTGELPPMPRRLAEKVARGLFDLLERDDPEREAQEIATLAAALDSLRQSFKH